MIPSCPSAEWYPCGSCSSVKSFIGGVGSGLYGMLIFVIIAVFVAGLMVGQDAGVPGQEDRVLRNENGLAGRPHSRASPCFWVRPIAVLFPQGTSSVLNPGPHGFSEILYAFSSAGRQQRQRLCRAEREYGFLQHGARRDHAFRPVLDPHPHPGDCRLPGHEKEGPVQLRDPRNPYPSVYCLADRR